MSLAFSLWLLRSVSFLLATKVQSIVTRQFLVCFQARGAPGEGQGNPGARGRPEDLEKLLEPKENLERKFSYGPIWAIKQMRNCHEAGAESEHDNSCPSCVMSTAQGPEKGSETEAFPDFCLWILLSQVL